MHGMYLLTVPGDGTIGMRWRAAYTIVSLYILQSVCLKFSEELTFC
jgi:hypothetical protein